MDEKKFDEEMEDLRSAFEYTNSINDRKAEQIRALVDQIAETCEKHGTNYTLELFNLPIYYNSESFNQKIRELDKDENKCDLIDRMMDEFYEGGDYTGWPDFWNSSSLYC